MDTNLVLPIGVDSAPSFFDYSFAAIKAEGFEKNQASIKVSGKVQDEERVHLRRRAARGSARAYIAGRLSVRRECGEHLFNRWLSMPT